MQFAEHNTKTDTHTHTHLYEYTHVCLPYDHVYETKSRDIEINKFTVGTSLSMGTFPANEIIVSLISYMNLGKM